MPTCIALFFSLPCFVVACVRGLIHNFVITLFFINIYDGFISFDKVTSWPQSISNLLVCLPVFNVASDWPRTF